MAEETKTAEKVGPNYTNQILCWIFAPITSLIWMNDPDKDLQKHAKVTLYFGIASIGVYVVSTILGVVPFIQLVSCCIFPIWGILDLVVRIMGAVKASKGELFEIPVISGMVK